MEVDAPDMECSLWPDGIPTWLGGKGNEWINCCQIHDHSPQNFDTAMELGACVANGGYPLMGFVMAAGVAVFGPVYLAIKRRKVKK